MANQIKKKFIGDDQIDGSKVLLENDQFFRVKLQNGTIKNLFKLDATDKLILSDAPLITAPGTEATSAQTKSQVEAAVAAEAALRIAADAVIQGEVDDVESALAQEILDRDAADVILQGNITAEAGFRVAADALLLPIAQKGAANGVAPLDASSLIPSQYLPGFVDDVLEYVDVAAFPVTGESGKIYVALDTSRTYRWGGSAYAEVSPSAVVTVNGQAGAVVLDSDDIAEGSTNLYYSDAKAQAANDSRFDLVEADVADHETRINALETEIPSWIKFKKALSAGDITNGYVDLAHVAVPGSLTANIDRLAIHEGVAEDFTLSTVGGVTRVTFVNSLVYPSQESLSLGDNVYFKFLTITTPVVEPEGSFLMTENNDFLTQEDGSLISL